MAKAKFEIPKELMNQMKKLEQDTPEMMKSMVGDITTMTSL